MIVFLILLCFSFSIYIKYVGYSELFIRFHGGGEIKYAILKIPIQINFNSPIKYF